MVIYGWIAERLRMGTPGYLIHLLYLERQKEKRRGNKHDNSNG
jgi:hypothetical protein